MTEGTAMAPQNGPNYVVLLSAQWSGRNGIEAWSLGPLFLQCFGTVGWVF